MEAGNFGFAEIPGEDQRVEDDYIDELIRKYLYNDDLNSFYEGGSLPIFLASPEADRWSGEMILPDVNYNEDCLVPELLLMENIHDLPETYHDVEPREEFLSILEEIIARDEKKSEEICPSVTEDSFDESIVKPEKTVSSSALKSATQETQTRKRKRPKRTSTDQKGKRPCRSQPIIMKGRAKQRIIEE